MSCGCGKGNGCDCSSVSGIDVQDCGTGCCDTNIAIPSKFLPSCAAPLLEDHCQKVVVENFYATLKIANEWNVPACGLTAILSVQGLKDVSIGSYIWNATYGYFQIIGFNSSLEQITVQNNCTTGNATPGTTIDSCTDFIIAPAPQSANSNNPSSIYPYVAVDFTAPNNGDCLLITLTTVNGLAAGKPVQIGSGTYRLSSVDSATTVTICNDGAGIVPGTAVFAKNAGGDYQYPVILIDANPCTNPTVTNGLVLACKAGVTQPLTGLIAGSVLVLQDVTTGDAAYEVVDIETKDCTVLTADLTLVNGTPSYVITIATNIFVVNQLISIAGVTGFARVDTIIDPTHLDITLTPTPSALQNIDSGSAVCELGCCDSITAEFGGPLTPCSNFQNLATADTVQTEAITNVNLNTANPSYATGYAEVTVNNTSTCRSMAVMLSYVGRLFGSALGANTDNLSIELNMYSRLDGGADVAIVNMDENIFPIDDAAQAADRQRVFTEAFILAPGETHDYAVILYINKIEGPNASVYHIDRMDAFISVIAVAV